MISRLIRAVIRWRAVVWLLRGGRRRPAAYSRIRIASLDAIPDISDPQIVVYVKWPRSPQLLETEVTEPLVSALVGSPDIQSIRGTSHMGYSFIYVILANGAARATRAAAGAGSDQRHPSAAAARCERRRSVPMPAAWAGFTSTRWSIGRGCTICASCV